MISTTFTLHQAEVEELTGTPRAKLQLSWLSQNGIPAVLGRDGKVKVLRAAVEAKMMPSKGRGTPSAKTEPNLDRLKKAS